MRWIQLDVVVAEVLEEPAIATLISNGCSGVQVIRSEDLPEFDQCGSTDPCPVKPDPNSELLVRGYLPDGRNPEAEIGRSLCAAADLIGLTWQPRLVLTTIDDPGWAQSWRKYFQPLRAGRRLIVAPTWSHPRKRSGDVVIWLDPGMAFGTGQHATTRLCLEALEAQTLAGLSVLDVGCGSGILSIAAALLGATRVESVDTDPIAVATTVTNLRLNNVDALVQVQEGSIDTVTDKFDCVVANILAPVLIDMAPLISSHLKLGGVFIGSGIVRSQVDDVVAALKQYDLDRVEQRDDGEWVCIIGRRQFHQNAGD